MDNLKKIRKQRKLLQEDVAKYLNVTTNTYSRYERGERSPDTDTLIKLSEFFDTSIDYIVGNTDVPMTLTQVRFDNEVDDLTDDEVFEKYNLKLNGEPITKEEAKQLLAVIRSLNNK